jgi:hypothetical protein
MVRLSFMAHADSVDAIDYTKDHTRAMKMLDDAGIHVLFVSLLSTVKASRNCQPID